MPSIQVGSTSPDQWEPYGDPAAPVGEVSYVRRHADGGPPEAGLWRLDPALVPEELPDTTERHETFQVLEGRGSLQVDGDDIVILKPGVLVSIPAGTKVIWRIETPFTKFYVLS